ncbi:MAG: cell division protein FtsQ/DivIB [Planktomarina sp.]|nr:cell division protein FtsQ/DivIB [Planktomarina sp.]
MQTLKFSIKKCLTRSSRQNKYTYMDPAPTVFSYRMQRLWLKPFFRVLIRIGLPVFFIFSLVSMFLSKADNRTYLKDVVAEAQISVQSQAEYRLQTLSVEGASQYISSKIRAKFGDIFPVSPFELNLEEMREWIENIAAVDSAVVAISNIGLLSIKIVEIPAKFVWRGKDGLALVSDKGKVLRSVRSRANFSKLPLIAGEGALDALAEAQNILSLASPIEERVRGLVRVGHRRWNLVLLNGQTIALPEISPGLALTQAIVLSKSQNLFERDITLIDFRDPRRLTLRLQPKALDIMKKNKTVAFLESQNE